MAELVFHLTNGRTAIVSDARSSGTIGAVVEAVLAGVTSGYFTVTADGTNSERLEVRDIARIEVIR